MNKNLKKIENSKKMVSDKLLRLQEVVENKKILLLYIYKNNNESNLNIVYIKI